MQDQDERNGTAPVGGPDDGDIPTEERRSTLPMPEEKEVPEPPEGQEEGRRPTPVRMVMEGGDEETKGRQEGKRVIHDEESGLDWVVTVTGWSASGILPLRTVPLMELNFAQSVEPERPLRRALCYGGDLADIPDDQILSSLRSSEPFREPLREPNGNDRRGRIGKNRRRPRD